MGEILFSSTIPVTVHSPKKDWIEYKGDELLDSVKSVISQTQTWAKDHNINISNIALSCQRSTCAAWDKNTGKLLAPIISWQDRRANGWLTQQDFDHKAIQDISGLPLSPHYGAAKLRWLRDNTETVETALQNQSLQWGPLSAYLLFFLCDNSPYVVDANIASRTQLWDNHEQCWSQLLCNTFEIDIGSLPQATPSLSHFGNHQGIPISLVIGDKQAELAALGSPSSDRVVITLGTCSSLFFSLPQDICLQQSYWLKTRMNCRFNENDWFAEALINGSGAAIQWFATHHQQPENYQQMNQWIESLNHAEKKQSPLLLNSVSGIASPFWKPDVTPRYEGDNANTTTEQYFYSLIESIAFWITWNIDLYHELADKKLSEIILAGSLGQCHTIGQISANLLQTPIELASKRHYSVEGAARMIYESQAHALLHQNEKWPDIAPDKTYTPEKCDYLKNRYEHWKQLIESSL